MSSPQTAAAARVVRFSIPLLALAACSPAAARSPDPGDAGDAIPVVTEVATTTSRPWTMTASGVVDARTTVDVAFQVPGKVVSVVPDEGEPVQRGQTIAALDPADYRLAVEQAAAQAERAARDLDRNRPLLAAGSISAADIDHLESGARQSAAAAELARKKLGDARLESPITGVVARRAIEVGATVAPGQPAFTIVDLDPVRVRIGVPEGEVGRIAVGDAATVRVPSLDATFAGRVSLIGVAADPATRSYAVEVSVPNPARRLRAGMIAEATITTADLAIAIMLPAAAVLDDGGVGANAIVYVVDRDGARVHARRVTIRTARGDSLAIASGVVPGERIVVAGQQRLREGARISETTVASASSTTTGTQGGNQP